MRAAADRMGFASVETDWRKLVARNDIDLIDICTPGDTHAEIAVAALTAGKHVLCEKPLANSVAEAERMADAAREAAAGGVLAMCGYTYRRTPALALARRLVADGRIGTVRHVRAHYLQDWLSDAGTALNWRLDATKAGSGALGDIGSHLVDTTQWLTGQPITGVSALLETFVKTRPLAGELTGLGSLGATGDDAQHGPVTVDDAALFTARFAGGALGIVRGQPVRARPEERAADRAEWIGGLAGLRLRGQQRAALLRRHRSGWPARLSPDPRHRTGPSLHCRLVAAGTRAGLRARLHAPGRRPRRRHRAGRAADAVVRRRAGRTAGAGRGWS